MSVGGALKENPFAPEVPCHRVIASNKYIGGYQGEWTGPASGDESKERARRKRKLDLLRDEGVEFDSQGYLVDDSLIWKP
jgi:methylated-DNA-[protein]-cysteine S-methyltransferase